ncbi:MAG: hypothetical protein HFG32_02100 [Eubacterium sp.]|jgi:hypothetical protein|nr:hypothetical protein [Eubacterium sp.]
MEEMLHVVKNVTVFVLLFSIVSNLFAKSKYEKYFDLVQGVILIILVMMPLFSWITGEDFIDGLLRDNMSKVEEQFREDELKMIGEQREQMLQNGFGLDGREADE